MLVLRLVPCPGSPPLVSIGKLQVCEVPRPPIGPKPTCRSTTPETQPLTTAALWRCLGPRSCAQAAPVRRPSWETGPRPCLPASEEHCNAASAKLRHDGVEQGPTEPHTGRSVPTEFWLCRGGITEWSLIPSSFLQNQFSCQMLVACLVPSGQPQRQPQVQVQPHLVRHGAMREMEQGRRQVEGLQRRGEEVLIAGRGDPREPSKVDLVVGHAVAAGGPVLEPGPRARLRRDVVLGGATGGHGLREQAQRPRPGGSARLFRGGARPGHESGRTAAGNGAPLAASAGHHAEVLVVFLLLHVVLQIHPLVKKLQ
mmetsp:Transcript_22572/g.38536  ORF Transcript_22572/g.38536 Transcript_22572/m.38536 type:complete len:312 (+) Transcript_22572:816-1751(+)